MYRSDKDVPPPEGSYARSVCHKHPDTQGDFKPPIWDVEAYTAMLDCQRALNLNPNKWFGFRSSYRYPVDVDNGVC